MDAQIRELDVGSGDSTAEQLVDKELTRLFPRRLIERVLLVAPPDVDAAMFDYATAKRGRYWNCPPYGLGIIAAHSRNDGLKVRIANLHNEVLKKCRLSVSEKGFDFDDAWKTRLLEEIKDFQPDIIGITCMFAQTHKSVVKLCNEIKRLDPALPVVIGGVHVTSSFVDDRTLHRLLSDFRNVDIFFPYEAELAFRQFVNVVNRKSSINALFQVYFNSSSEKFYFSRREIPTEKELDIIPDYDLMNPAGLTDYGVIGGFFCLKEKGTKITTVLSNRGCRGQCTYCSVRNFNGKGVRHRSVESVVEELTVLRNKYDIRHVMWLDDDFLHDHKRTLRLFDEMRKRDLGITWDCTNGVIALSCTNEIISAAAESGCIGLTLGVESGNPQILKQIRKPGNIDTFLKAAEVLRKHEEINSRVFLMIGFPNETYRMIADTFNLALNMDLDWYNITIFEPLPNTLVFASVKLGDLSKGFEFENIRYSGGPYGKVLEKVQRDLLSSGVKEIFNGVDLDKVPSRSHLEDIWFYMNYHLNFERLFKENRPSKLEQQLRYVQNITDLVAPEDPFPMYFCGYLQKKVLGKIDEQLIERLEKRLDSSKLWKSRFNDFHLSVNHLKTGVFLLDCEVQKRAGKN